MRDVTGIHPGACGGFQCEDFWIVKFELEDVSTANIYLNSDILIFNDGQNINLTIATTCSTRLEIRLLDINGKEVSQTITEVQPGKNNILITCPESCTGVYMVQIVGNNTNYCKRILIN